MKSQFKAIGIFAFILAGAISIEAQDSELVVGFTKTSGNDVLFDLGNVSSLHDGETWDVSALLSAQSLNTANIQWGVIGADLALSQIWTTAGSLSVAGVSPVNSSDVQTLGLTMYNIFQNNNLIVGAGNNVAVAASSSYSWNVQTLSPGAATDWALAYATTPNVVGVTSSKFYTTGDVIPTAQLGTFTLNSSGILSYAVYSGLTPPTASFVAIYTNGFTPLTVVFTNNLSTGSITNLVWNFGNGYKVTNSTAVNVTNTYGFLGTYTVSLAVKGPGGSSTNTLINYVRVYPTPQLSAPLSNGGKLVFNGTNCPIGVQYRILTTTNLTLTLANWTPVLTNTFNGAGNFSYTNSITNKAAFYRLVSP